MQMTYEDYLNEVTTLIFEENDVTEQKAVHVVVAAQDAGFFVLHDENDAMRVQEQAEKDALSIFRQFMSKVQ